ncbi:MAG: GntR family transcriptional regulator, partial [Pseudomonadota bacterium]
MPPTVERATSDLRRMIVGGMLRPGEKVSESSAAQLLGLSRTPARFALTQLESEVLIEKRAGRGYTVREIRPEDLEKAIEVRGTLEGLAAARLAAQGASEETLAILRESVATSEAAVSPAQ